ncbi:MAG: lipid II:glycine glycyltransferase FemX [Candidatus Gastranaerophilaceae bacterium]
MLKVFTLEESEKWDEIVRTFEDYDIYWMSGYVKAFKINGDGEPLLFFYEDDVVRGINVVMKRDVSKDSHFNGKISENTYFDFATPYGYGGWIIEGNNTEKLFEQYFAWCRNNGIICEFVRFHPVVNNADWSRKDYEVIDLGNTVSLDLTSPEIIWENITSKNRNMIRKATKAGIEIYNGRNEELYKKFREIYNATMEHDNAEEYYYFNSDFYESICYDLPENAQLFYAMLDGEMIAASIMIAANGKLNYHLSGSKFEYRNLAPSNLLLYKAALWGAANGCKTFHLGGGVGSGEDNLFKFKKSFYRKDDVKQFSIGRKIINEDKYDELLSMRTDIKNTGYFPQYRG